MEKKAKIYISGHGGMVGSAVVRRLKDAGFENLLLRDRKELDLLNQSAVRTFFGNEKPEYVIHAAALVGGIAANIARPAEFLYENLLMQNNVIWEAHRNNVKKLLFLGSSCIYPTEGEQPLKEESLLTGRLEPTNEGYALAKIAGIKLCEYIYSEYDKKFISCMPTNIYGEGDNFDPKTSHVIPALIRNIHEAKLNGASDIDVWGSGRAKREFLYVDDLADAILWIMENYDEKEFLNIGTGEDIAIVDLVREIIKVVGYEGGILFDTSKPDGMLRKLLNVDKLHKSGWKHHTSLNEGLKMTYEHFLENHQG